MEYQKIINLLGNIPDKVTRFIAKNWIKVYDQSGTAKDRYKPGKQIKIKTPLLRSDLCDYSDAYIVVEETITIEGANKRDRKSKSLAFKFNAPFISCISKRNGVLIENAEELDIAMAMFNLIEYSKNYRKTTGSLWNYYRDEPNDSPADDYNSDPITNPASFKYKSSIIGKTPNNDNDKNNVIEGVKIVVPVKHLGNFWNSLYLPLINCEVNIILTWFKDCVLTDLTTTAAALAQEVNPARPAIAAPTGATFKITNPKLYVPVVTLSAENDSKLLEQLKAGFKRTIKWNKYRS